MMLPLSFLALLHRVFRCKPAPKQVLDIIGEQADDGANLRLAGED